MKFLGFYFLFFIGIIAPNSRALGAVHGMDNRAEADLIELMETNPSLSEEQGQMLMNAHSATAITVASFILKQRQDGTFTTIDTEGLGETLEKSQGICPGAKFAHQIVLPGCSGFLVGPDLIVTAGHCVDKEHLSQAVWIFGYDKKYSFDTHPIFQPTQIYTVKEVIAWALENPNDNKSGMDFSLVRLDRPVEGISPLKIRKFGKVEIGDPLAIIGYPNGLTAKISAEAKVLDNSDPNLFKSNLDIFNGNSGSPVINLDTGLVEGILTRGPSWGDYEMTGEPDPNNDGHVCSKVVVFPENEGTSWSSYISQVADLIPQN